MSDQVQELNLSQEIEYLAKKFREELQTFLFQTEPLTGQTDSEKWQDFLHKISLWNEQYHAQSEDIRIDGYMMWDLDISIISFCSVQQEEIRTALLKILLSYYFKNAKGFHFTAEMDIRQYLNIDCLNLAENNYYYTISHQEFLADLAHYHDGSLARYEHWKKDYADDLRLQDFRDIREAGYIKYREYINIFQAMGSSQVVRINKLGEREGNNKDETEVSMYILYDEDYKKLHVLSMSDFF